MSAAQGLGFQGSTNLRGPAFESLKTHANPFEMRHSDLRNRFRACPGDHAAGETGEDRCQGRQARTVCHFPDGGGCRAEGIVPKNPPPHRWAAAGPFAAMTVTHPVASRSPDRTGVCCAGRSAPSQCEMATAPRFSSPNQPDQGRTKAYRDSSGPGSRSAPRCATNVGDWEEPSGESRLNRIFRSPLITIHSLGYPCYEV